MRWPVLNAAGQAADLSLAALIDGPQRSVANKERDRYRHPLEVLTFFGVKADSNVVEIVPGRAGYWNWIGALLPYLIDGGIVGTFIDWRGLPIVHTAATGLGLSPVNLNRVVIARTCGPIRAHHHLDQMHAKACKSIRR